MLPRLGFNYAITRLPNYKILLPCPLPILVKHFVHLLRRQVLMKIVVDLDRWRPTAGANALDFFQRKQPVGGGAFVSHAEFLLAMLQQFFTTAEQAGDIRANLDVKFSSW